MCEVVYFYVFIDKHIKTVKLKRFNRYLNIKKTTDFFESVVCGCAVYAVAFVNAIFALCSSTIASNFLSDSVDFTMIVFGRVLSFALPFAVNVQSVKSDASNKLKFSSSQYTLYCVLSAFTEKVFARVPQPT